MSNDELRCSYQCCKDRIWIPPFKTQELLKDHMLLHRCQWLAILDADHVDHCLYTPKNEEDLAAHIESHLTHSNIPASKFEKNDRDLIFPRIGDNIFFYCPWQTCTSISYSRKGTTSKNHLTSHIRNHGKMAVNDYKKRQNDVIQNQESMPSADSSMESFVEPNGPNDEVKTAAYALLNASSVIKKRSTTDGTNYSQGQDLVDTEAVPSSSFVLAERSSITQLIQKSPAKQKKDPHPKKLKSSFSL